MALARALVNQPKVLLLDEPLGALDLKLREQMQEELKALQRTLGITFVFVTHDQGEALSMADRVAVFNDGRIDAGRDAGGDLRAPAVRASSPISSARPTCLPPDFVQRYPGEHRWASLRPEAIRVGRSTGGDGVPAAGTVLSAQLSGRDDAARARRSTGLRAARDGAFGRATARPEGDASRSPSPATQLHLMEDEA